MISLAPVLFLLGAMLAFSIVLLIPFYIIAKLLLLPLRLLLKFLNKN